MYRIEFSKSGKIKNGWFRQTPLLREFCMGMNIENRQAVGLRVVALRFLAASVTFAALIGLLELGLRAYHRIVIWRGIEALPPVADRALIPVDDPALIFEFNPGWREGDFTVNRHGMPDEERAIAAAAGVQRVAFVGDSITAGFRHRPRAELYHSVFEEMAEAQLQSPVEALAFGANAYGMAQVVRSAEIRASRFRPDVLVVQLCLNDPYPSDTAYTRAGPLGSRLRNFIWLRLDPAAFWGFFYVERNYDAQGRSNIEAAFERLETLAAEQKLPVLVVLFPYLRAVAYDAQGYDRYHALYAESARAAGLAFLDLLDDFRSRGLLTSEWPIDPIHPGVAGHRLAAHLILARLQEMGWL